MVFQISGLALVCMKCKHGGHFEHVINWIEKVFFSIFFCIFIDFFVLILIITRINAVQNVQIHAIVFLSKNKSQNFLFYNKTTYIFRF